MSTLPQTGENPFAGFWVVPAVLGLAAFVLAVVLVVSFRRRLLLLRTARSAWKGARGAEGGPIRRLRALPAMLREAWRGSYPELTRSRILVFAVALVYLISPVDLVPELLPLLGITDDVGVGAWLLSSLYVETGHYVAKRNTAIDGAGRTR